MTDIEATDNLTPAQHNAISALLTETSVRKAAEVAGVKDRTLYNWLKNADFATAYREARREATSQAIARLQTYSGHAAATLVALMAPPNPAAVRLAAASKVLDLALRTVELEDLQSRIEALEHDAARII